MEMQRVKVQNAPYYPHFLADTPSVNLVYMGLLELEIVHCL